jgi:2-hydroxy-6-oxonona-2,4-dienedioate hydrolase
MTESFWLAAGAAADLAVRQVEIDGVDTRVIEAGDRGAPPVVCLHGTGGHAEAFIRNLAALSRDHHVLAYDLPAHGWSAAPERSYEIDGYCRHLDALLTAFASSGATLIGQSLGGWIAAAYAVSQPERVSRLVLVGAGGNTFDPAVMQRLRTASMAAVEAPTAELVRDRVALLFSRPVAADEELVACRQAIYARPGAAAAMRKALVLQTPQARRRNLFTRWAEIGQPTLVVWGRDDRIVPLRSGEEIAAAVPGARLVVLDGCGHWPQFEKPERFHAAVLPFLGAGVGGSQAAAGAGLPPGAGLPVGRDGTAPR